jgi:hypothetical protein
MKGMSGDAGLMRARAALIGALGFATPDIAVTP